MKKSVVVIPVYKKRMDRFEKRSFHQCCKVLRKYDICLLTYSELDCRCYDAIAHRLGVNLFRENFNHHCFDGIEGYNNLMCSKCLYSRFAGYQYMLVYQLDAFVFRDDLDYWCNVGCDFIGAPIFDNVLEVVRNNYYSVFHTDLNLVKAYNGGASLRKVSSFEEVLSTKEKYISSLLSNGFYEDIIFSILFSKQKSLPETALLNFSIESFPSECYNKNNNQLPMLCHAWSRKNAGMYDYEFWLKKIMPFEFIVLESQRKIKYIKRIVINMLKY